MYVTPFSHCHLPAGQGNVKIWGTQPDAIDEAEDRDRWMSLLDRLQIKQPAGGVARTEEEAFAKAQTLGYPVMVRVMHALFGLHSYCLVVMSWFRVVWGCLDALTGG